MARDKLSVCFMEQMVLTKKHFNKFKLTKIFVNYFGWLTQYTVTTIGECV